MAGLALTILLYLGGEPDVVRVVHPGAKPIKESIRRRDPERWKDLDEPVTYAVGREFTRAIERWELEHGRDAGDADAGASAGRSVRPHMRRAHSHLYWTGGALPAADQRQGRAPGSRNRIRLPMVRSETYSRSRRSRGRSAPGAV